MSWQQSNQDDRIIWQHPGHYYSKESSASSQTLSTCTMNEVPYSDVKGQRSQVKLGSHSNNGPIVPDAAYLEQAQILAAVQAGQTTITIVHTSPVHKVNPSGMAMIGFAVTMTALSVCQMRVGHAGPAAVPALVPALYLFGGLMLWVSSIMCAFVGKPIEHIAFAVFGSSFLVLGLSNQPTQLIQPLFSDAINGGQVHDGFAAFIISGAFFGYVMLVCSTNLSVVDCLWNTFLPTSNVFVGAGIMAEARGNAHLAMRLTCIGGIFGFCTALVAWYIFSATMFSLAELPFTLPMGNLRKGKNKDD